MRVRMREVMSGPQGTVRAGEETEVPDAEGKALIKGRYAEEVEVATESLDGTETAKEPEPKRRKSGGQKKGGQRRDGATEETSEKHQRGPDAKA